MLFLERNVEYFNNLVSVYSAYENISLDNDNDTVFVVVLMLPDVDILLG